VAEPEVAEGADVQSDLDQLVATAAQRDEYLALAQRTQADAIVAAFETDGYAREPSGGRYDHRDPHGPRAFYERLFAYGGGPPLEHCAIMDDGRACALEYIVVRWGKTELPPEAGVAVYFRGQSGKLAAVRIYDDADPPAESP